MVCMMTIHKPHALISLFVLIVAAVFGIGAFQLTGDTGYAGIGPAFLPTIVSLFLAALGLGLLYQACSGGFRRLDVQAQDARPDVRGAVWVSAGILLMAMLMKYTGFVIAAVVLFVCVARAFGSKRIAIDALIGAALVLPVFWLFTLVLDVNLPQLINKWL
jgi:putative tricarboxylic transport membrane protein